MKDKIRNYVRLLLTKGVNVQKDQLVVVNATTEIDYFAEIIAEEAYKLGAKEVEVRFSNDRINRLKYENAPVEMFKNIPQFRTDSIMHYANQGACFINLMASDPDNLLGVDNEKIREFAIANAFAMEGYRKLSMANKIRWHVAAVPGKKWADKIFANEDNAVEKMWEAILSCSYANGKSPEAAWESHVQQIKKRRQKLNEMKLDRLHFKSSNGTDIVIGLCKDHIWGGGNAVASDGIEFSPNIPTEEIYTAPHKDRIDGVVVSTKPLAYNGDIAENFSITYKNGKIIDYKAEKGINVLENIIEIDEGAKSLGEVAIVSYSSPINQTGKLFYNILFDENAACHFAFGAGYPTTVDMSVNTEKTIEEKGLNVSKTHVDFMFGAPDLECIGITKDGIEIQIMKNGELV